MKSLMKKSGSALAIVATALVMIINTACASGGWKTVRGYSGWVNTKPFIARLPLYVITLPIYVIAVVIDVFPFVGRNSWDFYEGKVAAGSYNFKEGNKSLHVKHEVLPESGLRQSTYEIVDLKNKAEQLVVLKEVSNGTIQVYVDGKFTTTLKGAADLAQLASFQPNSSVAQNDHSAATVL